MINQLRKVVAGPKKCTSWDDIDLDFTYITDFVVAMAFPASGLETAYRNSIKDISKFLQLKHTHNYLIINVSNREYDTELFHKKVNTYVWEDHQAPTLDVLFQVCFDAFSFLAKQERNRVVCFHCNHGKGRTGTAIICLILFTGFFSDEEETIKFYNKRRFSGQDYGVSQPCQLRYIKYFNTIMKKTRNGEQIKNVVAYRWKYLKVTGLDENYYIMISTTRTGNNKHVKVSVEEKQLKSQIPLICDIYIEVRKKNWKGDKIIARANINLNFLDKIGTDLYVLSLKGEQIRTTKSHHTKFSLEFIFKEYCKCHEKAQKDCLCEYDRKSEQQHWDRVNELSERGVKIPISDACRFLFETHHCESLVSEEKASNQSSTSS